MLLRVRPSLFLQYKASKLFLEVADAGDAEVAGGARVLEDLMLPTGSVCHGQTICRGEGLRAGHCEAEQGNRTLTGEQERSNELLLLAAQAGHRAASFNIAWRFMKGISHVSFKPHRDAMGCRRKGNAIKEGDSTFLSGRRNSQTVDEREVRRGCLLHALTSLC